MSSSSGRNIKFSFMLSEIEWQVVLDALSNTIFSEELTDEARKNAKELFLKLQKELPRYLKTIKRYFKLRIWSTLTYDCTCD